MNVEDYGSVQANLTDKDDQNHKRALLVLHFDHDLAV